MQSLSHKHTTYTTDYVQKPSPWAAMTTALRICLPAWMSPSPARLLLHVWSRRLRAYRFQEKPQPRQREEEALLGC